MVRRPPTIAALALHQTLASPHQAVDNTSASNRERLPAFLLLGFCHGEGTRAAHVVPGGLDPAVGALDVGDAERVDMAVEGVGDAAHMPPNCQGQLR